MLAGFLFKVFLVHNTKSNGPFLQSHGPELYLKKLFPEKINDQFSEEISKIDSVLVPIVQDFKNPA